MAIPIRKQQTRPAKAVEANQKTIDALAFNSGMWKVKGIPGLYVRSRAASKSFMLQRRIGGALVKAMLGQVTLKKAKEKSLALWGTVQPREPDQKVLTLGVAIEDYIQAKTSAGKMAPKTAEIARYNAQRYLASWMNRTLDEIGRARLEVRQLQQTITRKHKAATSNQVIRLLSAVYRWCRKADINLPESPMVVAEIHNIKPREWAYSPDELCTWWHAIKEKDGERREFGVKTLGTLKRMWWLTALLTGARKGSIEALRWADVDLDKRVIRFQVTKGDRPYSIPICDALSELLTRYKASGDVLPSDWVFPSPAIEGAHLVDVKNPNEGVGPAHRLRHTFRTTLAELGATPDQARMLMGHSMGGDISRNYISSSLVVESMRPVTNAVAARCIEIIGDVS